MAPESEPLYELIDSPAERLKAVVRGLLLGGLFARMAVLAALQFWILPHETNRRRAALAAIFIAPIALGAAWHGGVCRYHAVRVRRDWIELQRGGACDELRTADVVGLIGQDGIDLDGGELVVWKRLVILSDERLYVLAFHRDDNAALYRTLRAACSQAWGLLFPARLEPPDRAGNGPAALVGLGIVGRFHRRQIARTASAGLVVLAGCLSLSIWALRGQGLAPETLKGQAALLIGALTGLLLIASALRDLRVGRTIREWDA